MMELKDKVVFITGASRGIGRAIAYAFAKEKCNLVLTYNKDQEEGEKVKEECEKLGSKEVLLLHLDITNNQDIKDVIKAAVSKFGKVSILVNNAGVNKWDNFKDHSFDDIEVIIRTNLEGLIKITRESVEHVTDLIINISSVLGYESGIKEAVYSASKWGVRGFTKALALELPIKVYSVNPRGTATQMNDFQGDPPEEIAGLVIKLAKVELNLPSGSDINAEDYLKGV